MIGKIVSHYEITDKIGRGGMGEIYLAEDTKLDRRVALKFLPVHLTVDKEARLRFEREAKAAAALNHPNIVTVFEIGEHEGQVFIAMEYVEGRTLKEMISVGARRAVPDGEMAGPDDGTRRAMPNGEAVEPDDGARRAVPLPISDVVAIATQIAAGLAAAHAKGIVHRDIKPQNIVIEKDGHVKILDFGLAKLKGVSPLTKEAFTYGTVHYMSPEQALGKEVDPRSDIWSLGVVMYEMISGELPFRGEYDQAVIYSILNEEMPPLAAGKAGDAAGLENVIRHCLAKKRQDRYPSAEALAAALRDMNSAKESTRPEKSSGMRFSRRAILASLSLLMLFAILGFVAFNPRANAALRRVLGLAGIPPIRHMAVLPFITSGDAETKALGDGFTAVITDKLTLLEKFQQSLWTVPSSDVFQNRGSDPRSLERMRGCNLLINGELRAEANALHLRLQLQDAQSGRQLRHVDLQGNMANLSLFQEGLFSRILQLLDIPEPPGAGLYVNSGGTSMPGAYILYLKGRGSLQDDPKDAGIDQGISFLQKALQQDSGYTQARLALAEGLRAKYQLKKDPALLQQAVEQTRQARQAAGQWAPAQLAWALLLKESGQTSEAQAALRETLRLNDRCFQACIELAKILTAGGRISEAEDYYKLAIGLRPGYPRAFAHLGYFYQLNGRLDEALAQYQQQAKLAPGDFNCLTNMGNVYLQKGDKAGAVSMFERSIAIQPNVAAQSNLATISFYDGEYRQALSLFKEIAGKSPDGRYWGNLADTYRQLPEFKDDADATYRKAILLAEAALADTPDDAVLLSALAIYYAHVGEKKKALESIARARALAPADLETIRREVLACEAAGERSQALAALREYRERLGSIADIEKEPDLAGLRRDPVYRQVIHDRK
jgi:serine/threonine protein kinase/tetratricopeptide (TPR) repeat protein